jgi:catechol 2,3-dioxygenase-like lactoylglutathione lyase family enzyme
MEQIVDQLLGQFEHGRISRRQLVQALAFGMAAAAAPTRAGAASAPRAGLKAVAVNHISYEVADYRRTRDFYADLFGMEVSGDDGQQCILKFGADSFLIARNARNPGAAPLVDHLCYTIADWDKGAVEAELRRRGLVPERDTDESFHVRDPDGYDLQVASSRLMYVP